MENAKMMDKRVTLKSVIVLVLIAVLIASGVTYVLAVSPSSTFTVSPGVYPGAPSYTIWREGSNYFAKNANGELDYSGTNASYVIQSAIFAIPESSSGYIVFKAGKYSFDTKIVTSTGTHPAEGTPGNRNLKLIGEGGSGIDVTGTFTELEFTGTGTAIEVAPDSDFIMEGFRCVGGDPFLDFKDSGGGRGHIHRIAHCNFVNNTVAIRTGARNPFMEIYRNRFRCTELGIDWGKVTDGNIEFNYFEPYDGSYFTNASIYVHADNGFLTILRNIFLANGQSPDFKLECNNDGYIQIMLIEHNKFGCDGLNNSSQTERIKVIVAAGTSNPVVSGCSFSYNTIANSAGVNSVKHFILYSGTSPAVTFTKVKVNDNIVLSAPYTGYLIDGSTSASSCRNEALGNIKQEGADFLQIVNGTASAVDGLCQGFTVKNNKGYCTENSGSVTFTNEVFKIVTHGLAGTPNIAIAQVGFNTTFTYYVTNLASTTFTIVFSAQVSGVVYWYVEYKP